MAHSRAMELKNMTSRPAPHCKLETEFADTILTTWFERDRAHVCLSRKDRDGEAGETIIEWWDEAVSQAVEDGFLNARDWHGTAFRYAQHIGAIKPVEVDFKDSWQAIVDRFTQSTPAGDRPADEADRLEWYGDKAGEIAEEIVEDKQFAALSAGQTETLAEMLRSSLYDLAVAEDISPAHEPSPGM